ncbi:MAG: pilus assembly protein N-terminal domain-containing protein [Comamonas sp.]
MAAPSGASWAQVGPVAADTAGTADGADRAQASGTPLNLAVGMQQQLIVDNGVARIAIGDPNVLDVNVTRQARGKQAAALLLTPKAAGSTTLTVWPRGAGAPEVYDVSVHGRSLTLDRSFSTLSEQAAALADAKAQVGKDGQVKDFSNVGVKSHTVQVDVKVVEFSRSMLKEAGINLLRSSSSSNFSFGVYQPGSSTETTTTGPISSALNLMLSFASLNANISIMETNGLARVLAEPTLIAHSGQSASFLAGGELPIPVSSSDGQVSIQYKQFGISLQLTPTVLSSSRIALKVAPEASELDYTNAVTLDGVSVPALSTRRADTTVELGDGESFVIGGLVSRTTSSSVDKVPLLGDLPIIGTFFKSLTYTQDERELVIVVTPHLVSPLPPGTDLANILPGAASEQRNGRVWSDFLVPTRAQAVPGFSQ